MSAWTGRSGREHHGFPEHTTILAGARLYRAGAIRRWLMDTHRMSQEGTPTRLDRGRPPGLTEENPRRHPSGRSVQELRQWRTDMLASYERFTTGAPRGTSASHAAINLLAAHYKCAPGSIVYQLRRAREERKETGGT